MIQDTSIEAYNAVKPHTSEMEDDILGALALGDDGTCSELAAELGISILNVRPTVTRLMQRGLITYTPRRRKNGNGRNEIVVELAS